MRVGITLYPYGEKKPAGLGRAILEITRTMLEADSKNEYTIFLKNLDLKPDLPGNNWKAIILTPYVVCQLDICIFNTPVMPWWYGTFGKAKKSVVIAYDFAYIHFSKNRFLKLVHHRVLKKADLIISISEATKKDLIEIFKIPEKKIKVVYLGFNNICNNLAVRPSSGVPEKFFLFVGAIKERKNVHGIIEAFSIFKKSTNFPHKLVIAGNGSGEYFDRIKSISSFEERVIFLGQISDSELSFFYQNAEALLYSSFIEGFGFPVLEAQACGLPVVTSNTFSLPEVAGDGAVLVDPKNPVEIAEAMKKIAGELDFRKNLIEKGFENTKKFSWRKTAQEILGLL